MEPLLRGSALLQGSGWRDGGIRTEGGRAAPSASPAPLSQGSGRQPPFPPLHTPPAPDRGGAGRRDRAASVPPPWRASCGSWSGAGGARRCGWSSGRRAAWAAWCGTPPWCSPSSWRPALVPSPAAASWSWAPAPAPSASWRPRWGKRCSRGAAGGRPGPLRSPPARVAGKGRTPRCLFLFMKSYKFSSNECFVRGRGAGP